MNNSKQPGRRGPENLVEIAFGAFDRWSLPDQYLTKRLGSWTRVSGAEVRESVERLAAGLRSLGVKRGDRVALMSASRLEWMIVDLATLLNAAVLVPIYPTLGRQQCDYVLRDSDPKVVIVGDREQYDTVRGAGDQGWQLASIDPIDGVMSIEELSTRSGPALGKPATADDLATLIYTSGTTGDPKGVMLSHGNIASNVHACAERLAFMRGGLALSFLPLAHIFERMTGYFMISQGVRIAYAESIAHVAENLKEIQPTFMTAVPRILEKVANGMRGKLAAMPTVPRRMLSWSLEGAELQARRQLTGEERGLALAMRAHVADAVVFEKVRKNLGGRLTHVITGGAKTPDELTVLFKAIGVSVLPGYGLTETSPVIATNSVELNRLGSVGRPISGVEVRIAPDGEILTRGPHIMRGYWHNEAATKQTINSDGWLSTGDLGRVDTEGYLYVTDRKKDILVTTAGKNIAPQPVEQTIVQDPLIEQVVLLGDGRHFISALLVPCWSALESWAASKQLDTTDRKALLASDAVQTLYRECLEQRCEHLSKYEMVKKFTLLESELTIAADELTPTLKVKRRVVAERYKSVIDGMYADAQGGSKL